MIRLLLPVATLLSFGAAAPLFAEDASSSVTVRYADLDLSGPTGQWLLRQRVAGAVVKVCGEADARDLTATRVVRRCRDGAEAGSAMQVATAIKGAQALALRDDTIRVAAR